MPKTEKLSNNLLKLEITEDATSLVMKWLGKSTDREPDLFISPILARLLDKSINTGKKIIMDFQDIEYINSSTITPVSKMLEKAKKGSSPISVLYKIEKNWQELSFSALKIFETKDKRIEIIGK